MKILNKGRASYGTESYVPTKPLWGQTWYRLM